jgi:hypothetical protein
MLDDTKIASLGEEPRPRRAFWFWPVGAVILLLCLLFAYGAGQWYSQNPLKFRITDVRLDEGSSARVIRYELRNASFFPVQVLEYTGICRSQEDPAFPFKHTEPETLLIKPGAVVSGEFRMYSGLRLPADYTKYVYRWVPTSQPRLKAIALWLRSNVPAQKASTTGTSVGDNRFSSFIEPRMGEHDGWAEDFYRRTAPRDSREHGRQTGFGGNFGD